MTTLDDDTVARTLAFTSPKAPTPSKGTTVTERIERTESVVDRWAPLEVRIFEDTGEYHHDLGILREANVGETLPGLKIVTPYPGFAAWLADSLTASGAEHTTKIADHIRVQPLIRYTGWVDTYPITIIGARAANIVIQHLDHPAHHPAVICMGLL